MDGYMLSERIRFLNRWLARAGLVLCCFTFPVQAEDLTIACQGRLLDGAELIDGEVSMILRVYDRAEGGQLLFEDRGQVSVEEGYYTTTLGDDATEGTLEDAFASGQAWLEVIVDDQAFLPREKFGAVPFAMKAQGVVDGAIDSDSLADSSIRSVHLAKESVTSEKIAPSSIRKEHLADNVLGDTEIPDGSITSDKLAEKYAVLISEDPETFYMGSPSGRSLSIQIGGTRALLLQQGSESPSLVGGHIANKVLGEANGVFIGGGGNADAPNIAGGEYAVIAGGSGNLAKENNTTIAGGLSNVAEGKRSTIGGGRDNEASGIAATIGGGFTNKASGGYATIGGGYENKVDGYVATVAGGWANTADGVVSTVAGGQNNEATGAASTIGGGWKNKAVGDQSVVPGGQSNVAEGKGSFAAGRQAQAKHDGSFVWSDGEDGEAFESTDKNQFLIQASGNVGIDENEPKEKLTVAGNVAPSSDGQHSLGSEDLRWVAAYLKSKVDHGADLIFEHDGKETMSVSTAGDVNIQGRITAAGFAGDGSELTGIPGDALAQGSIYDAHLSTKASIDPNKIAGGALTQASRSGGDLEGTFDNLNIRDGAITREKLAKDIVLAAEQAEASGKADSLNVEAGTFVTIAGGTGNSASNEYSTVGGGANNAASGSGATVGGGWKNKAVELDATVGGGQDNAVTGLAGTIAGGFKNKVAGDYAVIPGGSDNEAVGDYSYAAGRRAIAGHDGAVVWADSSSDKKLKSTGPNQFIIRAEGGVGIGTDAPDEQLTVAGTVKAESFIGDGSQLTGIEAGGALEEGSVKREHLAEGSVTPDKLTQAYVTSDELQTIAQSVLAEKQSYSSDMIPNGAITPDKLSEKYTTLADLEKEVKQLQKSIKETSATSPAAGQLIDPAKQIPNGSIDGSKLKEQYATERDFIMLAKKQESLSVGFNADQIPNRSISTDKLREKVVTLGPTGELNPQSARDTLGSEELPWDTVYVKNGFDYKDELSFTHSGNKLLTLGPDGNLTHPALRLRAGGDSPNVIGGHAANRIPQGKAGATIGGGGNAANPNRVEGEYGTVAGGIGNVSRGYSSAIGGGQDNAVYRDGAVVAGGFTNVADGIFSTISGGAGNRAGGKVSGIAGGFRNEASGAYAMVAGGFKNSAQGDFSFAAGYRARALHRGSFVWADSTDADLTSTGNNQFVVRAKGGAFFYSDADMSAGTYLSPGSGAWSIMSDRKSKENFEAINSRDLLERVGALSIGTWNYKAQGDEVTHLGPAAQDFQAAFGLGEDERFINSVDADGVALAAIQGLYEMMKEKETAMQSVVLQNHALQDRVKQLEEVIKMMANKMMLDQPQP